MKSNIKHHRVCARVRVCMCVCVCRCGRVEEVDCRWSVSLLCSSGWEDGSDHWSKHRHRQRDEQRHGMQRSVRRASGSVVGSNNKRALGSIPGFYVLCASMSYVSSISSQYLHQDTD